MPFDPVQVQKLVQRRNVNTKILTHFGQATARCAVDKRAELHAIGGGAYTHLPLEYDLSSVVYHFNDYSIKQGIYL